MSLKVSAVAMVGSIVIGVALALGMVRARSRARLVRRPHHADPAGHPGDRHRCRVAAAVQGLRHAPVDGDRDVAEITFSISYVTVILRSRVAALNPELEEAAMDLGATRWQALRLVTLPALMPAILASSVLIFALVFDDFVLAYFTTGVSPEPLSVRIYSADPHRRPADDQRGRHAHAGRFDRPDRAGAGDSTLLRPQGRPGHPVGRMMMIALSPRPAVRLDRVSKSFGAAICAESRRAVRDVSLDIARRRVLLAARPVRLRQDHVAADDRRLRRPDRGLDPARRRRRHRPAAEPAQRQHRVPELRRLRPPDRRRQRRVRPQAPGRRQGRDPQAGRRHARPGAAGRHGRPAAAYALRRSAPARRARPGPRLPARGAAAGRAAGRARPEAAPADAGRAQGRSSARSASRSSSSRTTRTRR